MPATNLKFKPATAAKPSASVVALAPASQAVRDVPAAAPGTAVAASVLPPLVMLALILGVWQLLCSSPTSSLPPPARVLEESWELIVDPFYRPAAGIDQGLFWHICRQPPARRASAIALAARRRHRARHARSARATGRCAGSIRSSRCCAPCRRSPGCRCRWPPSSDGQPFGDLRHLHHRDLAGDHQHRRRHPQHSAGLPNVAKVLRLNRFEYLLRRSCCRRRRPTSSPACASASASPGSRSSRPRC